MLIVSFVNKYSHPWCEAGYEQSFDQFIIKKATSKKAEVQGEISFNKNGEAICVNGEGFELQILKGKITSLKYDGKEYLKESIAPNYFRALTDNDISNFNFVPFLIPVNPYFNWRWATNTAKGSIKSVNKNEKGQLVINVNWSVKLFKGVTSAFVINPDGSIELTHTGTPKKIGRASCRERV